MHAMIVIWLNLPANMEQKLFKQQWVRVRVTDIYHIQTYIHKCIHIYSFGQFRLTNSPIRKYMLGLIGSWITWRDLTQTQVANGRWMAKCFPL